MPSPAVLAGLAALSGTDWPPAIGETVGIERAHAALATFDPEIRRVGAAVVDRIETDQPGIAVHRRIVTAAEIAAYRRDDSTIGCVVAVVDYIGRSGSLRVIGVNLTWDGARIYVPDMPDIEA